MKEKIRQDFNFRLFIDFVSSTFNAAMAAQKSITQFFRKKRDCTDLDENDDHKEVK